MRRHQRWIAFSGLILLASSAVPALAQSPAVSTLPAARPTQHATISTPVAPALLVPARAKRAQVTWAQGQLTIRADDSSLNQILREVSRVTGMTVTGGVADERVFGRYGPADPGTVLAALLAGTGSNMMLEQGSPQAAMVLVLTPRQGGASPPSPQAYANQEDRDEDLPPQQVRPDMPPSSPAQAVQPFPGPPVAAAGGSASTTDASAQTQSANGVKTPQQIYDQLMKMQQQKAGTPAATPQ